MYPKLTFPGMCALVALVCFTLSIFLPGGRAEIPQREGADRTGLGARCRGSITSTCRGLQRTGCQPYSVSCGDPFNVDCSQVLFTEVVGPGTCTDPNPQYNCVLYTPFRCAQGTAYYDPDGTGLCQMGQDKCTAYPFVDSGCVPVS